MGRKLEIAQNAKSCSKRKKLLEIREVAKKLPSNLWKALASFPSLWLPPSSPSLPLHRVFYQCDQWSLKGFCFCGVGFHSNLPSTFPSVRNPPSLWGPGTLVNCILLCVPQSHLPPLVAIQILTRNFSFRHVLSMCARRNMGCVGGGHQKLSKLRVHRSILEVHNLVSFFVKH